MALLPVRGEGGSDGTLALDGGTINALAVGTTSIYTGYMYRPYTAHTGWLRVSYLW